MGRSSEKRAEAMGGHPVSLKTENQNRVFFPETLWQEIFCQTGELSNLSPVCRFFKLQAEIAASQIYQKLVETYSEAPVVKALESLGLQEKSLPAKIDALFHAANETHFKCYKRKKALAFMKEPYHIAQVSDYLNPFIEAESLYKLWSVVACAASLSLFADMMTEETGFSKNPLERSTQIIRFFHLHKTELSAIEELYLSQANLIMLPLQIGLFTGLKTLDLSNNRLSSLPSAIRKLQRLESLDISQNHLLYLPAEIGSLTALEKLFAAGNKFERLPDEITMLVNLQTLNLNENHLSRLPKNFGDLSSLSHLYIENNHLQDLPDSIGKLKNLKALYLFNNRLESLPFSISGWESLKIFSAPQNYLSDLPEEIGSLNQLEILVVANNRLNDLPLSTALLGHLQEMYAADNHFAYQPLELNFLFALKYVSCSVSDINTKDNLIECEETGKRVPDDTFVLLYGMLGPEKWKECIDGVYHLYGPEVFDKGLHGGAVEPGFLRSMYNLFEFLKRQPYRKIDANFYLEMHSICCSHFQGAKTQTLSGSEKIGVFRDLEDKISANFSEPDYKMTSEAITEFNELNDKLAERFGYSFSLGKIEPAADVANTMRIYYQPMSKEQIRIIFNFFTAEFYFDIRQANNEEEKLHAIAKYIQHLEWLHPPRDGCGRTDTALLNFLMTVYGFTPVLLNYPYLSSCRGLEDWKQCLYEGMQAWKKESFGELVTVLPLQDFDLNNFSFENALNPLDEFTHLQNNYSFQEPDFMALEPEFMSLEPS